MSEDRPAYAAGTEAPPTPAEIAERLRRLADEMLSVSVDMTYFGGFGPMGEAGTALQGAAHVVRSWAHEMTEG